VTPSLLAVRMTWLDLAFLHWRVEPERLSGAIPAALRLETFDGSAWLGVVPFRMTDVGPRVLPPIPGVSAFPELNVRTYVEHGGRRGVWFFSLDAGDPLAVRAARRFFHLPYFDARMSCRRRGDVVDYRSVRTHRGQPPLAFRGRWKSVGEASPAAEGSLEDFLTRRESLFAVGRGGRVLRGDVEHDAWSLEPAEVEIEENTMAAPLGLALDRPPDHVCASRRLQVLASPLVVSEPTSTLRE
jgi:uncharacterized protein YqjF (DUF2071 family)